MQPGDTGTRPPPLDGIRVIDLATIYAGPLSAALLGDFGADVIKVEHPRGDPMRGHGPGKDGHGLWWKVISRNKRTVTLDLAKPEGQQILLELAAGADVLVENFRPGVLEGWGLGYEQLSAANPGLVLLRTTGFGQVGPYRSRPGFGTLAESMSGFAALTGHPDGPPTLPPFGLADGISGIAGAYAVMLALFHRDARGGAGQVIDLAIIEPIMAILGAQPTVYDQLGLVQRRNGNRSSNNAPRNIYLTNDGRWVAISTSAGSIARRVMTLVGHPEVIDEEWFATGAGRAGRADLLDGMVDDWIAERSCDEVIAAFAEAGAAAIEVYDIVQVMADPQYSALESIVAVEDDDLGPIKMQNVMFRLLGTPGAVRHPGRRLGQDNDEVYAELGLSEERRRELQDAGVI